MEELNNEELKLTPRQWAFYRLLESNEDHWFTQKEICDAIPSFTYKETSNETHDHCAAIGMEKRNINSNPRVDKVIVMKNCCFKIGTFEEYKEERASHIARLKSQKAQIEALDAKFERHSQVKFFNNILDELKEENEQIHVAFAETKFPDQINGVKVYTRVAIDWKNKIAYIITAQKIKQEYDIRSASWIANCLLADESIKTLYSIQNIYEYDYYLAQSIYKDFKREFIK